jgi:hypothetical protein
MGVAQQPVSSLRTWGIRRVAAFPRTRALAWGGNLLYASRGYTLLKARIDSGLANWDMVGRYRPEWWRNVSSSSKLAFRLFRDGFHALAVMPSGGLVAVVPGAIITLAPGENEFHLSHRITRGTRPLHITATPDGRVYWGEYFDNPQRDEVHIYASADNGASWNVAYTFPKRAIRHVHNIVHDSWERCLWVLTGDDGAECRILKASLDFKTVDPVLSGNQQARAVALVAAEEAVYFSSDTPFEQNHIYRLDRRGELQTVSSLASSSIHGAGAGGALFFSTMVEPSSVNPSRKVVLYGSLDGMSWQELVQWQKDRWPMGLFQYGNASFAEGNNSSGVLAVTTVGTSKEDLHTTLWRVVQQSPQ